MSGFITSLLKKRYSPAKWIQEEEASHMNFGLARVIKYEELKKATNNFSRELGNGGYGRVYLGKLQDGQLVAVKVLFDRNPKRIEQFFNEVALLSRLRHKNLVSLYGCTSPRSQELLLVYEYVPNGTVADHLHGKRTTLTWAMRVQIATETAEALVYLHALEPPLIHRDVKTSNILLDYDFHVKVADFGICRLLPWDSTHVSTMPQGTMGYRDPEYELYLTLTNKTDVYSFGVVLMELISGQQAVDVNRAPEDIYLDGMALKKILNKKLDEFVDPILGYHSNNDVRRMVDSVAELATNCLQPKGDMRPSMLHVLTVLKGIQTEKHQMQHQDGRQDEVHVKGIQHEKQQQDNNSFDPLQVLRDGILKEVDREIESRLEEGEQLARALQESLNADSPPRQNGICAGCNIEIGHGRFRSCMGAVWHPDCFRCHDCNQPISDYQFSMYGNHPYHTSCYKESYHPKCDVCKQFIPTNLNGLIEYRAHPFWLQKYCPSHEVDGTPRCCSCERMEPRDTRYVTFDDGRKLCLECFDSAMMDNEECQPLYLDIQEFYEGLNMKVEQQIPLLLVERQALNEAMEGEKNGHHHLPETRGLCLSEEQIVSTISRRPSFGAGNRIIDMTTEPFRLIRRCDVTAILILYGLPRLLTGSILAHEMMHAWLRLKGYRTLRPQVEEGICQVLAHMWIDSEVLSGAGSNVASTSSSSSSSSPPSKKRVRSQFERKLEELFKHQIESDTSSAYGDGFRAGNAAVLQYGLRRTLDHIKLTGSFPY